MDLFSQLEDMNKQIPLAEILRPKTLDDFLGQSNVVAPNSPLLNLLKTQRLFSLIFWGTPGCGKTTLLRKIAESLLRREDIIVEYMPQNYEELLDLDMTPIDFLSISGDKEEITRLRTFLGSLKYTIDEMDHPIRELSGGQKAKVLLLKMSLSKANVLILDEPTRNFSPLSGPVIRKMLSEFPGAIISISHDRKYIDEVCDVVYELTENGLKNILN
jgi:ATPase subunit of ABC transporter with duplicated ATPase domains